jgi:hypothetical protein
MKLHVMLASLLVAGSAFAQSAPPAGSVAIHYNRCDGNYAGWGVHLWKDPGIPLVGVEWQKPMMPAGQDDFGVYWHTKLDDYAKGKVNYIIHKGDTKDQGGRDMSFDGNATKEIWVNDGDRKIYASLEEAKKGREAKPCK